MQPLFFLGEGAILNILYAGWRMHIFGAARGESAALHISGEKKN
jgi:hypothetical protein